MAANEFMKLTVQTRVDDKVCSFGLHYKITSGGSLNENAANLINGFIDAAEVELRDLLGSDATLEGYYAASLAKNYCLPCAVASSSLAGTSGTTVCPANSCLVITLQHSDPVALRSGRIYVSGIGKENLVDGRWKASWLTTEVAAFRAKLVAQISNGGTIFDPVVVQRVQGGIQIDPTGLAIVSARATDIPYTQRRRTSRQLGFAQPV